MPALFLSVAMTFSAGPIPLFCKEDIGWRHFMTVATMGFGSALGGANRRSLVKTRQVSDRFGREDLIERQAASGAGYNCVCFYSCFFSKFYGAIFHALNFDKNGAPLVSLLCSPVGPPAIFRAISLAVVDTVNRIPVRARTHVFNERAERRPSFADRDASPAVIFPLLVSWIEAAVTHASPHIVKRMRVFKRHFLLPFDKEDDAHSAAKPRGI